MQAPPAGLTIRAAVVDDVPAIAAIATAARTDLPDITAIAEGYSIVATLDGPRGETVVGYLLARPLAFAGEQPLTLWIEAIVVHPTYQRQAIATALYAAFGARARDTGVRGALTRLDPADLTSRTLHEQAGFEPHQADIVVWRFTE